MTTGYQCTTHTSDEMETQNNTLNMNSQHPEMWPSPRKQSAVNKAAEPSPFNCPVPPRGQCGVAVVYGGFMAGTMPGWGRREGIPDSRATAAAGRSDTICGGTPGRPSSVPGKGWTEVLGAPALSPPCTDRKTHTIQIWVTDEAMGLLYATHNKE